MANYQSVRKKLIDSKELIISPDLLGHDYCGEEGFFAQRGKDFIALYENVELQRKKYEHLHDSLYQVYIALEKKTKQFQQLINGNLNSPENIHALQDLAEKYGIRDKQFKKRKFCGKLHPNICNWKNNTQFQ